jgi:acylphosphatase
MLQTIFIEVRGQVQGVFYRQSANQKAHSLGITGTVANQPDGSVHIVATAQKESLDALVNWCRQGPPKAVVSSVRTEERPLQLFDAFAIERNV